MNQLTPKAKRKKEKQANPLCLLPHRRKEQAFLFFLSSSPLPHTCAALRCGGEKKLIIMLSVDHEAGCRGHTLSSRHPPLGRNLISFFSFSIHEPLNKSGLGGGNSSSSGSDVAIFLQVIRSLKKGMLGLGDERYALVPSHHH